MAPNTTKRVTFSEPTTTSSITVDGVVTKHQTEETGTEPYVRSRRYTDRGGRRPSRPVEGGNPFDDDTPLPDASVATPHDHPGESPASDIKIEILDAIENFYLKVKRQKTDVSSDSTQKN